MRAVNKIGPVGAGKLANTLQANKSLQTLSLNGELVLRGSGWGACNREGWRN